MSHTGVSPIWFISSSLTPCPYSSSNKQWPVLDTIQKISSSVHILLIAVFHIYCHYYKQWPVEIHIYIYIYCCIPLGKDQSIHFLPGFWPFWLVTLKTWQWKIPPISSSCPIKNLSFMVDFPAVFDSWWRPVINPLGGPIQGRLFVPPHSWSPDEMTHLKSICWWWWYVLPYQKVGLNAQTRFVCQQFWLSINGS